MTALVSQTAETDAAAGDDAIVEAGPPGSISAIGSAPAAPAAPVTGPVTGPAATRGKRHTPLLRIRGPLAGGWRVGLGIGGIAMLFAVWVVASARGGGGSVLVPSPAATWRALANMWSDGTLVGDIIASSTRIGIGYGVSVAVGVVFGIAIGSFSSVEALFEPQFAFLRYIPASALTPLFMLWLGIGESPKIWLIVAGTVFYNVLMIADVARAVPRELLNASYTLGAGRWTILRRVIFRHSFPGMIDVARINLASAWLMLVVAELLAADKGLALRIVRAQRFRAVDTMFALLLVFGIIGLLSDLFLRGLRNRLSPWARP